MNKANPGILKAIRILSAKLPQVNNHCREIHLQRGSELIEDEITEIEGVAVIPERMYSVRVPVILASNHYRRLRKAFERNGQDGINSYLNRLLRLYEENKKKAV